MLYLQSILIMYRLAAELVNEADGDGRTALMVAARAGNLPMVELLLH